MKQVAGQLDFNEYLNQKKTISFGCEKCICNNCLYWWSMRCKHGKCYDDHRARIDPYDKAFPEKSPRTGWTEWNKPGEQAHWCRGGSFYPVSYCEHFVKFEGASIEECVDCNIVIYQDGHVSCGLKDIIGCEECIARSEGRAREQIYGCPYMTEVGCEAHINALALMAHNILNEGENMEMCGEQCCIGCTKTCGYRCGQAYRK